MSKTPREPRWLKDRNIKLYENTETIPPCDWSTVELKEFQKSFIDVPAYTTASREYTEESLRDYYNEAEVKTFAKVIPYQPPMVTYEQTPFPPAFHDELKRQGFDKPHNLFAIAWAHILRGQNFCVVAQNGPWCLAYILPCLIHVNDQLKKGKSESFGPIAFVVTNSPMRAEQLLKHFNKFGPMLNISTHMISGGKDEVEDDPQVIGLQKNPNVVIAVVGSKFTGLIVEKKLNLKQCTFLVFDDATLLHNFARSVENVLGQVRRDRQIIMWNTYFGSSICNAQEVIRRAKRYEMNDHLRLYFGSYHHFYNPNTIKHVVDFDVNDKDLDFHFKLTVQTILTAAAATGKRPKCLLFRNGWVGDHNISGILYELGITSKKFRTRNKIPSPFPKNRYTGTKTAEICSPKTIEEQLEINQIRLRDDKVQCQFWVATDTIPLAELDFSTFDCIINYEFPSPRQLYDERADKFLNEAGQGTIYTLLCKKKDKNHKYYMSDYLLAHNQYCPSHLALETTEKERQIEARTRDRPKKVRVRKEMKDRSSPNRSNSRADKYHKRPYPGGGSGDSEDDANDKRRSYQRKDNLNDNFGGNLGGNQQKESKDRLNPKRRSNTLQMQSQSDKHYNCSNSGDSGDVSNFSGRYRSRFDSNSPIDKHLSPRLGNLNEEFCGKLSEQTEMMNNSRPNRVSNESGTGTSNGSRFGKSSTDYFQRSCNDISYNHRGAKQNNFSDDFDEKFGGIRRKSLSNRPLDNYGGDDGNDGSGWFKNEEQTRRDVNHWN